MLLYKGYKGTYTHDAKANMFRGEIVGLSPAVEFRAASQEKLKDAFKTCVNEYLQALRGQEPEKTQFLDYWNPEEYVANSSLQQGRVNTLLKHLSLRGNERILDVGCGDGRITAEVAARVPQGFVQGTDISPSMIGFANKKFANIPNASFVVMDAKDINYNQEFDVILSFTALQFLRDHPSFLAGAYRSLKSPGILALTMPISLHHSQQQTYNELISSPEFAQYFKTFSTGYYHIDVDEYKKQILAQGFEIVKYDVFEKVDIFSYEAFKGFVKQVCPYLGPLPEHLRKPFLDKLIARFLELEPPSENGDVKYITDIIEVVAKKT